MGSFKPKTFGLTILAISTVIIALMIGVNGDGAIGAIIPPPALELVTINDPQFGEFTAIQNPDGTITTAIFDDDLILPNVACWIKQEVSIFSLTDPTPIAVLKSPFFRSQPIIGTPIGSFVDTETGRLLSEAIYVTIPEIKCVSGEISTEGFGSLGFEPIGQIDPDDPTLFDFFPNLSTPLTVQDSFFKIFIFAELPNGTWKEVFNAPYTVERFDITGASATLLDSYTVRQEWIERYLPEGDYNTKYRFVYDGAFLLNWKESNVCGVDCSNIPFVIPVVTEKTHNAEGQIVSLFNAFQVSRDITVGKPQGSGEETITCDDFTETIDPESGLCVPIPSGEQRCPQGEVRIGSICVDTSDNGGESNQPQNTNVDPNNTLQLLTTCIASGDPSCLASSIFLPFWIFGIGGIVVIGALAQRKQPEIYGVPTGGF